MKRILALLIALVTLFACGAEESNFARRAKEILLNMRGGAEVGFWIDTALCTDEASASDLIALSLIKLYPNELAGSDYPAYIGEKLSRSGTAAASTYLRMALVSYALGNPVTEEIVLSDKAEKQGLMSRVFALHCIQNGFPGDCAPYIEYILNAQLPEGGWAIMGKAGDPDVTAMVLQVLCAYPKAEDAVNRGVEYLSKAQTENGGYTSYGAENCESACQAAVALAYLGIDPASDPRFIKNGNSVLDAIESFACESGYSHTRGGAVSASATAQALLAYTALSLPGGRVYITGALSAIGDSTAENFGKAKQNIKLIALCALTFVWLAACAALYLAGRRRPLTYISLTAVIGLCVLFVLGLGGGSHEETAGDIIGSVTLEVRCDTVAGREEWLPSDGILLGKTAFELRESDTAADILKKSGLRLDIETGAGAYVKGIGLLYEFSFGELSGWTYFVNGTRPSVGCGDYTLSDGDEISFRYTLELGEDVK